MSSHLLASKKHACMVHPFMFFCALIGHRNLPNGEAHYGALAHPLGMGGK